MIKHKEAIIAYHCPQCGSTILNNVNIFTFAGGNHKMKCRCSGSELTIQVTNSGKLRLTVPCIVCPTPHIYTVSMNSFFEKNILSFPCTICGIDVCFVGKKNPVIKAVDASEENLIKLFSIDELDESRIKDSNLYSSINEFLSNDENEDDDDEFLMYDGEYNEFREAFLGMLLYTDTTTTDKHEIKNYISIHNQKYSLYTRIDK